MTAKELSQFVGCKAIATIQVSNSDRIQLDVTISDCRIVYGRVDYQCLIPGLGGFGSQLFWLSSDWVNVLKED